MPDVHFLHQERVVTCRTGETIRAVAHNHGIVLKQNQSWQFRCYGLGLCRACLVRVIKMDGVSRPAFLERLIVRQSHLRQACRTKILENVAVWTENSYPAQVAEPFNDSSMTDDVVEDEVNVEEIEPEQVNLLLAQGEHLILLDVREPYEFERARIDHALLIPLGELSGRVGELDSNANIIVICHHGMRSHAAVGFLQSSGFKRVRNLRGGIDSWSSKVDSGVPRY